MHIINTTQKEKEMKKSVRLSLIIVAAVAAISTTVAASTFIQSNEKLHELERAARLQNLSVRLCTQKFWDLNILFPENGWNSRHPFRMITKFY